MFETDDELEAGRALMERSYAGATSHLQAIIGGERRLGFDDLVPLLDGMKVLALSTVTAGGEPRVSAVDGHFLHGRWTFGTDRSAAKAQHMAARPAVSAAYLDGERLGVFTHGTAVPLSPDHPRYLATMEHWTRHYGESPLEWGDTVMYELEPTFLAAYRAHQSDEGGMAEEPPTDSPAAG